MPILDQHGQPIPNKPVNVPVPSGAVSIDSRYRLYPLAGLTPSKLSNILRSADDGDLEAQYELFENMEERDGHLFSQLQTRKLALAGLEWRVEPADSSAEAKRLAEEFEVVWKNLDTHALLMDLSDAVAKGVSKVQVTWSKDSGTWLPAFEHIEAYKLSYQVDTKRFAVRTLNAPQGELLPYGAEVEHRFKARSGSPVRAGLMRTIAWWFLFKHFGIKDWASFAELFGIPFRLGKYDPSTGSDERDALERAVRSLGSDGAGVISKDTEIEIISVATSGSTDVFEKFYEICNREMSLTVLGQTLTSNEGNSGTQALGKVHERVRLDLVKADAIALAFTLLRDLVRPWVVFNHGADKLALAPKISPQITEPEDLTALADNLDKLQNMGLELPEMWVRQKFGVPPVEKGEATLKRTIKPAPTLPGQIDPKTALEAIWAGRTHRIALLDSKPAPVGLESLEPGAHPSQPGVIEGQAFTLGLIGNGTQAAREPMLALVEQVLEQVQAADGVDDLHDRLVRLYPDLDMTSLQRLLETGMVLAELAGMYGLRQGQE
jgi:phage gp29-like protein